MYSARRARTMRPPDIVFWRGAYLAWSVRQKGEAPTNVSFCFSQSLADTIGKCSIMDFASSKLRVESGQEKNALELKSVFKVTDKRHAWIEAQGALGHEEGSSPAAPRFNIMMVELMGETYTPIHPICSR